jgi:RNA polymerase sigma-70 factor, ECF subfamily
MFSPSEVTDEALMLRFQRGDRESFVFLVKRHRVPLYNFALRQLRAETLAEDVVQEAFVRVVQNAGEFKHEARFSTWVYTIVRNLCIDQLRKRALRKHPSLDEPRRGADGDASGPTLLDQTADRISCAVDGLPDDQREVFLLRELSNLPFKEIAEITGVPENTVKSRMRYALERLQEQLSEYEDYARALR